MIYNKLLPGYPHPSVEEINKFIGEVEIVFAMLLTTHHPNLEQLQSVVQLTPDSPPILLTELLPENLNSYTARMKGKLPIHVQLDLCHDMARGLQFLHTAGLIHNNLHGANVLISQDGQAKIADYICPLVDSLNEKITPQHGVYTSPELVKNITVYSRQSDIYSLGVLCLQVATQSPPMPNDSPELSDVQRWKEQLDQITTNPLMPLILKCLSFTLARPSIDHVCSKIATAKQTPQSVMSNTLYHIKVRAYVSSLEIVVITLEAMFYVWCYLYTHVHTCMHTHTHTYTCIHTCIFAKILHKMANYIFHHLTDILSIY